MAKAEEDSPYDFADEPKTPPAEKQPPPAQKRTALPGKPQSPAAPKVPPTGATPAAANPAAPAPTTTAVERTCPHCGFTFMGKPKARCPECAAPLDSSSTDLLQFAHAPWVRTVALGALILIAAIAVHMLGSILKWTSPERPEVKGIAHAIAALLVIAGVFLATRKDPGIPRPRGVPLSAQLLAIVAAIGWIIFLIAAYKGGLAKPAFKSLLTLVLFSQAAMAILLGFHFQSLATRIPDDSIASHAFHAGWLTAVVCFTMTMLYVLEMTTGFFPMFFMCSFPLVAGFVAIFLWAMVTLLRLALNMRAAAAAGESIAQRRIERAAARKKPA